MSRRSERQPVVASAAMPAPAPLEPEYEDGDDGDDAVHLKRRPWAAEEDEHLVLLVEEHGVKAWAKIAQFLHMRNGKQCRERYRNHLRPELCKGEWSVEEDTEIWNRVREVGTKWAAISELFMPTRTDNDIKNRWNSIIRKPKAPGGREWTVEENEARTAFIGTGGHQAKRQRISGSRLGLQLDEAAVLHELGLGSASAAQAAPAPGAPMAVAAVAEADEEVVELAAAPQPAPMTAAEAHAAESPTTSTEDDGTDSPANMDIMS